MQCWFYVFQCIVSKLIQSIPKNYFVSKTLSCQFPWKAYTLANTIHRWKIYLSISSKLNLVPTAIYGESTVHVSGNKSIHWYQTLVTSGWQLFFTQHLTIAWNRTIKLSSNIGYIWHYYGKVYNYYVHKLVLFWIFFLKWLIIFFIFTSCVTWP